MVIPPIILDDVNAAMEGRSKTNKLVDLTPSQISDYFDTMTRQAGINKCTFHSLRHYYASVMLANNVPNKYAMEMMGHETENMLHRVYQHTMNDKKKAVASQINQYFSDNFIN